jgi:hypothetical protein
MRCLSPSPKWESRRKEFSQIRKENGTIAISKIETNSKKINLKNILGI